MCCFSFFLLFFFPVVLVLIQFQPCNKCVSRFDHHCAYLSTCIGKANYWSFILTIIFGAILCTISSILSLWAFFVYFHNRDLFENIGLYSFFYALHIYYICPHFIRFVSFRKVWRGTELVKSFSSIYMYLWIMGVHYYNRDLVSCCFSL